VSINMGICASNIDNQPPAKANTIKQTNQLEKQQNENANNKNELNYANNNEQQVNLAHGSATRHSLPKEELARMSPVQRQEYIQHKQKKIAEKSHRKHKKDQITPTNKIRFEFNTAPANGGQNKAKTAFQFDSAEVAQALKDNSGHSIAFIPHIETREEEKERICKERQLYKEEQQKLREEQLTLQQQQRQQQQQEKQRKNSISRAKSTAKGSKKEEKEAVEIPNGLDEELLPAAADIKPNALKAAAAKETKKGEEKQAPLVEKKAELEKKEQPAKLIAFKMCSEAEAKECKVNKAESTAKVLEETLKSAPPVTRAASAKNSDSTVPTPLGCNEKEEIIGLMRRFNLNNSDLGLLSGRYTGPTGRSTAPTVAESSAVSHYRSPDNTVMLDLGSYSFKLGHAGEVRPAVQFPSVIARAKQRSIISGGGAAGGHGCEDFFIGNQTNKLRGGDNNVQRVIRNGAVSDWELAEKLFYYGLNAELHVSASDQPVILAEPTFLSAEQRERLCMLFFETFHVPALYLANHAVLSLFSTGKTSGLVIDSGYEATRILPIYEGYSLNNNAVELVLAGKQIDEYLVKLLLEKPGQGEMSLQFITNAEQQLAIQMKERHAYVSADYRGELYRKGDKEPEKFDLPDGNQLTLDQERFQCSELLFQPHLNGLLTSSGKPLDSLPLAVAKCIKGAPPELQEQLYGNIFLSGGTSGLNGLPNRLKKELRELCGVKGLSISKGDSPGESAWIGGSMLASLSTFKEFCITAADYDEFGPSIVHRKCF
jgi:actin